METVQSTSTVIDIIQKSVPDNFQTIAIGVTQIMDLETTQITNEP